MILPRLNQLISLLNKIKTKRVKKKITINIVKHAPQKRYDITDMQDTINKSSFSYF